MSKTPFSSKCRVLGQLWLYYQKDSQDNKGWANFFAWADISLPLSYILSEGFAVSSDTEDGNYGRELIEETWIKFCEMIDIDPDEEYKNINEAWNASPNPSTVNEQK